MVRLISLRALPSVAWCLICLGGIVSAWEVSEAPEIYIFSKVRLVFLAGLLLAAIYFAVSVTSQALSRLNNSLSYTLISTLVLVEIILRVMPEIIPLRFAELFPGDARKQIAREHGLFTEDKIVGDGMFFHLTPNTQIGPRMIDSNGFFNRVDLGRRVDVVILGASAVAGATLQKDLADQFRDGGLTAYSLAMGGMSISHYRQAYERFIITPKVPHKNVVIGVLFPTELQKAITYQRVENAGGDYKAFLSGGQAGGGEASGYVPWTVIAALRFPRFYIDKIHNSGTRSDDVAVTYSWGSLAVPASAFDVKSTMGQAGWGRLEDDLGAIIDMARQSGARVTVLNYPLTPMIALPYADIGDDKKNKMAAYHSGITDRLSAFLKNRDADFIDATETIRAAQYQQPATNKIDDYHPNELGVGFIYQRLLETVH